MLLQQSLVSKKWLKIIVLELYNKYNYEQKKD
jgi:hypothetical protein